MAEFIKQKALNEQLAKNEEATSNKKKVKVKKVVKKKKGKGKTDKSNKPTISLKDFWSFFTKTSALGLAIGVVMADAVNTLVGSIVNGVVTPLLSLLLPKQGFSAFNFMILDAELRLGDVVSALINFFVLSALIYLVVRGVMRNDELLSYTNVKKSKAKVKREEE